MKKLRGNSMMNIVFTAILVFAVTIASFGQAVFTDVTSEAGIDHQFDIYDGTFGGGVSVLDFDNDGWEDVFIPGGMSSDQLLRNNHDGTFSNVYDKSGLYPSSAFVTQGAAAADVNKDGWVDILITTIKDKSVKKGIPRAANLLFINNGNSTFRNATKEYGLSQFLSFSQGACFGDVNADGFPDLYIGNYFQEYEGELNVMNDAMIVASNQMAKGYLLINKNGEYFENEYEDYGLTHKGFGFGGMFTDFDNDRDADLLINHDFGYKSKHNLLMRNEFPEDKFADIAKEKAMDRKINAMGVAAGDYNNDGWMDYYITNIRANHLMVNRGEDKPFENKAWDLGAALNLIKDEKGKYISISWGANFADFDHDTDLDLFVANGCLNPNVAPVPDFYFENNNFVFKEKSMETGLHDYGIGRGSVTFDYDNDGDLDILVVNQRPVSDAQGFDSKTRLYRNDNKNGNWIRIALNGRHDDTHGIGTRIEVFIDSLKMIREVDGGSSHLSQSSIIAHFGLADAEIIDSIVVKWPGGEDQILVNQPVNRLIQIQQAAEHPSRMMTSSVISAVALLALAFVVFHAFKINKTHRLQTVSKTK